ncbi:phage tail tape measure protein [Candidatus Arsenophonus nilaparvatae]|uniref:phage tail tape measure protein n=1 Tax=Candidatus Arsenophonus nilaparvatae TaxID=1247023 RepID=UPI0005099135|nr:phage tail tape measure protein [Candidatus Arsenophonus nilaparvatae]
MTDIATISLKVNTADLERGQQKLKSFQETAEKVEKASSNLEGGLKKVSLASLRNAETLKTQKNELNDLLNRINPTNKAFDELDKISRKLAASHQKGLLPLDQFIDYNTILEESRDKLSKMNLALTAEGRALLVQEEASKRAKLAADNFLNTLKQQSDTIGKTRTEILELKAAQMGISQQAAPMIARLKAQEKAFMNGAVTMGQYRHAMRMLPMQMTDVVTSLASGMPAWMVLVQQGGQIKDSFGGVGNAFKAIGSILTPTRLLMGGLAGVTAAVAIAAYKGSQEFSEFNKHLILTGGYAGKTAGQLDRLAKQLSADGITQGGMADVITKVVGSGSFSGNEIDNIANVAARMEKWVGQSVDETIKQFQRIKDDPVKAINELDKSLHFLTETQLEQISTLEEQGRKHEAAKVAMEAYATATKNSTQQIKANLGYLESAWAAVNDKARLAWDSMLDIGREHTLDQKIREYEERLVAFQVNPVARLNYYHASGKTETDLRRELDLLKEKKYQQDIENQRKQAVVRAQEAEKARFRVDEALNRKYENAEEKHQSELERIRNSGGSKSVVDEAIRRENARYAKEKSSPDSKTDAYRPSLGTRWEEEAQARNRALQAELRTLQDESQYVGIISQQRRALFKTENQLVILEEARSGTNQRRLSEDEQSLLLKKEAILSEKREAAEIGDKIEKQKQLNALRLSNDGLKEEIRLRLESIGKTEIQIAKEQALKKYREEMARKGIDQENPEYGRGLSLIDEKYKNEASLRKNWEAGIKRGFTNFEQQATDAYANVANVTQFAFEGMSQSLTDFLVTGKANFADFTKSLLEMMVKLMTQMAILKAMKSAFGGQTGGVGGAIAGILGFSSGGYVGGGGKYDPKGIVHGGEFVFTKEATQRLGIVNLYRLMDASQRGYASGGYVGASSAPMYGMQPIASGINVNLGGIHVDGQPQQSSPSNVDMRAAEQSLTQKIKSVLVAESRDGGDLHKIIKAVNGRGY